LGEIKYILKYIYILKFLFLNPTHHFHYLDHPPKKTKKNRKKTQICSFEDWDPHSIFFHILLKKKDPANTWLEVGTHTHTHPPPTKGFV
jgi:hypothetical protein